jgi:type II secretory pathway pseudopilin PulG
MSSKPFRIARARLRREVFTLKQRGRSSGFTLAELLVSVFVLTIIIFMVAQLMNSAAALTKTGNKHISTDTQARVVFDRMALDFAQMLKRTDIDYYVKQPTTGYHGHGNGHGYGHRPPTGMYGSDQIAFYSQVPGYYPATGSQSSVSLVAYRIFEGANTDPAYQRLQRMGKGLLWNGVDNPNKQANHSGFDSPIVFLPLLITNTWPAATDGSTVDVDNNYDTIGPGVFRFEYYYLLKTGAITDVPWNTDSQANWPVHTSMAGIGLGDVESITVAIAVVDPTGRALIDAANANSLNDLASDMPDFHTAPGRGFGHPHYIGDLEASWQTSLLTDIAAGQTSNGYPLPPEAAKTIRVYSKTFDLRTFP